MMKRTIEVELKFQILDIPEIEKFLKNLKFVTEKRIVDVYLDIQGADLFKQGIFIRIRNQKKLDFKFNAEHFQKHDSYRAHDHCDEFSFTLPLLSKAVGSINKICRILSLNDIFSHSLKELKKKNNLLESLVVDKLRQEYIDKQFVYSYDEVKNLGRFIEIEYPASLEDNIDQIKKEMRKRLEGLGIKHVNVGYNELYWRKHNFNLYLEGLYLLDEDYKKYRKKPNS